MATWSERQKKVAIRFGSVATFVAVTAAFLGFPGFKSVNVIACMLGLAFIGLCVTVVGWLAKIVSKNPLWMKVYKTGWMLTIAPLVYVAFELVNPIL